MNPLRVLNLKKGATKRDIIQAAAAALRERKYAVQDVALAQQALMDPAAQAAYEFVSFLEGGASPSPAGPGPLPCGRPRAAALALDFLPIFQEAPACKRY